MYLVTLTNKDIQTLNKIVNSNKSTQYDRLKAQVLLLTDTGEYGPKVSSKDVSTRLQISLRSVGRVKMAYSQNSLIEDVFRFAGFSNQSISNNKSSVSSKKKNTKYIEIVDDENESFLVESVKCRVALTNKEREQLELVIKEGKQSTRKFNRAKILLLADEGDKRPAKTDKEIADKLDVSMSTVARVRRLFITKGEIHDVLEFNHKNAGRRSKIDGRVQATLIAQACSKPPIGRCRWTVRLLANQLVALEVVDSISHTAVAQALKKMNLNLGNAKNG